MSDTDPAAAAREEAARQGVGLFFFVLTVAAAAVIERKMSQPDTLRQWRMRAAKATERASARAAAHAWRLAEWARLAYDREAG